MIKRLTGGAVYDPAHGIDGQVLGHRLLTMTTEKPQ